MAKPLLSDEFAIVLQRAAAAVCLDAEDATVNCEWVIGKGWPWAG